MAFHRTHTSTGSTKKFTYSCWIKQSDVNASNNNYLFSVSDDDGANYDESRLLFQSTTPTQLQYVASDISVNVMANSQERDPSGWKHVMVVVDTTLDTSFDRVKLYVNGVRKNELFTTTMPAKNAILAHNFSGNILVIGAYGYEPAQFIFNGGLLDVYNVDGQALTPDVFGFYKDGDGYISAGTTHATDFKPGQWVPKKPSVIKNSINNSGGFGVNGFYLPMNDSSNFGADFHTTPNSIIKLQEDLPQPKVSIASTAQAGLAYTDVLRTDPYAANLVLAIPFVNSGLCTDGTNSGISTGFGDYSHIINTSQTAKDVQLITYNGTTPTIVSYASSSTNYYGSACFIDGNGSTATGGHIRVVDDNIFDDLNLTTANWTIEGWFNPASRSTGGSNLFNFGDAIDFNQIQVILDSSGDIWHLWSYTGSAWNVNDSGTTPRPPLNEWSHIAFEKVGTATTSYITTYVNGVAAKVTSVPQNINYSSNPRLIIGGHYVSGGSGGDTFYYDGLVSDVRMYNVAKYKGGFDVPKPYTPVGIGTWRAVPDTTANNFSTLNPLQAGVNSRDPGDFSDGNLTVDYDTSTNHGSTMSNIGIGTTGNWYAEARVNSLTASGGFSINMGITGAGASNTSGAISFNEAGVGYAATNGELRINTEGFGVGVQINYGASYTVGDIIGIGVSGGDLTFFKNGTSQGVAYTGITTFIENNLTGDLFYGCGDLSSGAGANISWNFGQNPTFSGNINAGLSTFTDDNGVGLFRHEPPAEALALCEDNLPTPAIKNPGDYFKTVIYTGDGNTGRSITGIGFTPDLVWIKARHNTWTHSLFDSVRGPILELSPDNTLSEGAETDSLLSFNDDGFTYGTRVSGNQDDGLYVAWCWQAGAGTTSLNTSGDIDSVISVNQEAGFSIVSYDGVAAADGDTNGGNPWTIAHGLGKKPDFMIFKQRSLSSGWYVYHQSLGTNHLLLNNTVAQASNVVLFRDTEPTNQFINVGGWDVINRSGRSYISYCWSEIEGHSKFGSYVGNGNNDGPFIYCGFKPAWVMIRNADTSTGESWWISDNVRSSINVNHGILAANSTAVEDNSSVVDFLSNGFKVRTNFASHNENGLKIIYVAFAESPFKTANAK